MPEETLKKTPDTNADSEFTEKCLKTRGKSRRLYEKNMVIHTRKLMKMAICFYFRKSSDGF